MVSQHALSSLARRTTPPQNFFSNLFQKPPNPADAYKPDPTAKSAGLPRSYAEAHSAAVSGVQAAIADGVPAVEVDFPLYSLETSVNERGDGSPKSQERVNLANAEFVKILKDAIDLPSVVVGCDSGSLRALGSDAVSLRDAKGVVESDVIAICVSPALDEQWDAVMALGARCVVVVNGCLVNGRLPHAYYYKPMTAASQFTGGVVRCFPGAYECWDANGRQLDDLEISLQTQGNRALPNLEVPSMRLRG